MKSLVKYNLSGNEDSPERKKIPKVLLTSEII